MTEFQLAVYQTVQKIPSGRVATYAQIAREAGYPGAARAVGNALHTNPFPDTVPCFRVVHADGSLCSSFAFGGIASQRELLVEDGVAVVNYKINLAEYQWDPGGSLK